MLAEGALKAHIQGKGQGLLATQENGAMRKWTALGPFVGKLTSGTDIASGKYHLRVSDAGSKTVMMYSPPSVCPLGSLNEPNHGERANCHLIKFTLADTHDWKLMTGDEAIDEVGMLWVVTARRIPREGDASEELTIHYGDEYCREDYPADYRAMPPRGDTRPNAKEMASIISEYCSKYGVDYAKLVRAYGV